jgi:hypothetical protein
MKEQVFNLFVFITGGYVRELGVVVHEAEGADDDKLAYLRNKATTDAAVARHYPVPSRYTVRQDDGTYAPGIHHRLFQQMTDGGRLMEVVDEVLEEMCASRSPLVCVTPVVDGIVTIDGTTNLPQVLPPAESLMIERYPIPDYFQVYMTEESFDLARLLNDDFFRAFKVLWRERLFVSAAKLLMSAIDTVAYLNEGDQQGNFARWLNSYVEMSALGVTGEELWEFRNSLLHTTGLDSRKIVARKVQRILFYVGAMPAGFAPKDAAAKYFNLHQLFQAIADGLEKWTNEFNHDPQKFKKLLDRYDKIVSDVRYEVVSHSPMNSDHP